MQKSVSVSILALALWFCAAVGAIAQTAPFEPVHDGQALEKPADRAKLASSIRSALISLNWRVVAVEEQWIIARYEKNNFFVEILVVFSNSGYSIEYRDSENLDVNLKRKTIHRNYMRWVRNLDQRIYAAYYKQ